MYTNLTPGTYPLTIKITRNSHWAIGTRDYNHCRTSAVRHGANGTMNLIVECKSDEYQNQRCYDY
jgi:hypothetical protein